MRVYVDTSVLMNIDDFVTNWCISDESIFISYYSLVELEGLKNSRDKGTAAKARKALHFCEHDKITVLAPEVGTDFWTKRKTRGLPDNNDGKIIRACFADAVSEKKKYKPTFYSYDHAQITLWESLSLSQNEDGFAAYLITLPREDKTKPEILDDITGGYGWICASTIEAIDGLQPNQYTLLDDGSIVKETVSGERVPLEYKPVHSLDMGDISPLNPQQEMMFDLLQNKDIKVKLIKGIYGAGKNYVCLGHALELVRRGKFDKIVFIRNNIQVKDSKDIGALPGSEIDKLFSYLMPIADHVGGEEGLLRLIEEHIIEPVHLGFLRGRDFQRTLIFCDECENLTRQHVQLILGRVGKGSEVWFAGDQRQKDAKVFEENNGMGILLARLTGNPLFGTVTLIKSERSEVAQLADLLD